MTEIQTDELLVKEAIRDSEYFLELMNRYEARLLRYIKRTVNVSDADAEDILQEVFIKSYQNLNSFDTSLKFSSWMYRITYNHCISYFRKHKKDMQVISSEDNMTLVTGLASDLDVGEDIAQKINQELLISIMRKMDSKYRTVLILKYLEEKDYKEISDIMKIPMGTVATYVNRAKKQLKKLLISHNLTLEYAEETN